MDNKSKVKDHVESKIDWEQIREWDDKYCIHIDASKDEYEFLPVERVEGDYIYLADGSRYLDMVNQLLCVPALSLIHI